MVLEAGSSGPRYGLEGTKLSRFLRGKSLFARIFFSEYLILFLSLVYFLVFSSFIPALASRTNLGNIFSNSLPLLVVGIGQTFVLISGGIDLSVTSIIALSSVVGGMVMNSDNGWLAGNPWAVPVGVAAMLLVGGFMGWLNGSAVTRLAMPPFIVTLTVMMFFSGFAIWLTQSRNIRNLPSTFNAIGNDTVLLVPNALLAAGVVAVLSHLVLSRSLYGRWLYAVGVGLKTSIVSGVPAKRVVLYSYVISGMSAAIASILYTGRLETASPVLGQRVFLDVIGAAVIGGTSLFGGRGKVVWTLFGVLFITLIDNSLNLLGLSNFMVLMVKGAVILSAAIIDAARTRFRE
jgi:ribose/xylose/arabinose/galactoside ABC-type transport system permease subunit